MFGAIGKYLRAIGYLITGRIDAARKVLSQNPAVVQATYDRIIEEKRKRIGQYKDAVAAMIAQEEKKKADLKHQSEEVARLRKLAEGAAAMAKRIVERHGGDIQAVKQDPEYNKCHSAFNDFSATVREKEARCQELEDDLATIGESINQHKVQLQSIIRDLDKIKQEKHEAVADMITAKEEREIADIITGISEDRTSRELAELRDLRQEAKAGARISREMAGLDSKQSEAEFLQYAEEAAATDEFDRLIGLSQEKDAPAGDREPTEKSRIPESLMEGS